MQTPRDREKSHYRFYAVRRGRATGVYWNWPDCHRQIYKYRNAEYKGFSNLDDAVTYVYGEARIPSRQVSGNSKDREGDNTVCILFGLIAVLIVVIIFLLFR